MGLPARWWRRASAAAHRWPEQHENEKGESPSLPGRQLCMYILRRRKCSDYFCSIWRNLILLVHKAKTVEWNCDKAERQNTQSQRWLQIFFFPFYLQNGTALNAVQSESKEEKSKKIVIVSRETSSRFVLMDFCFQDYTKSIAMIIEHSIWERANNQVSICVRT